PATLRGLWVGPFLTERYGLDAEQVGWAALLLGVAMIAGSLAYGPLDRLFGTRKWVILAGNLLAGLTMVALGLWTGAPLWGALVLISLAGLFSASFALVIAHARAFAPPHLAGRAVTLMNMFSIGGAGLFQYASAQVHALRGGSWTVLFLFFGLPIVAACLLLAFARDNMG